ncbi:MAG TPA: TolC family protein [Kofleriaceae bacterium]|jgi:outer membrane protein TolC
MTRVWVSIVVVIACAGAAHADDTLTIDQAVQLALTRNERSRITELSVVEADAGVARARVAFLPVLAANGAWTLHPVDKEPKNVETGDLALTQPIFAPSAFPLYDQAKHLLEAQLAQTVDDKRLLAFDTARAFFAVLLAQRVVDAAQRELDTATYNVKQTDAQYHAAIVSSNDVTRAKVDLAGSQRELATDQGNDNAALVALGFLVNTPAPKKLTTPDALFAAGKQPVGSVDELVAQAVAHRPDLVARKATAVAAHDFAREPRWRYLPSLGFLGELTTTSNNQPGTDRLDGFVALQASWTIWDGGAREADSKSRDAAAEIEDLQTKMLVRSVANDVRTAAVQLTAAQNALSGAQDAVDASRTSVVETSKLYDNGLAKAIELVDANEQRFTAEVSYAEAEYAVANAYLALRQAMGLTPLEDRK